MDWLSISSPFTVSLEIPATCHSAPTYHCSSQLPSVPIRLRTQHSSIHLLFISYQTLNPSNLHGLPLCHHLSKPTVQFLISHELSSSCPSDSHSPSSSGPFLQGLTMHSSPARAQASHLSFFFSIRNCPMQFFLYSSLVSCLPWCH